MAEKSEKIRKMAKEVGIPLADIYEALGIPQPVNNALAEKIAVVETIDEAKELFDSLPHREDLPTRCKKDVVGGWAVLEKLYELYIQKFATVSTVAEAVDTYRNEVKPRSSTPFGAESVDDIEKRALLARWCELVTTFEEAKKLYWGIHPDYHSEEQAVIRKIALMYDV